MRPVQEMPVHYLRRWAAWPSDGCFTRLEQYHELHALIWAMQDESAKQCGVHLLEPLPYICDGRCCYGCVEGVSRYVDADRLSERGKQFLRLCLPQYFLDREWLGVDRCVGRYG